ncbi:MAG: hypothetical protein LBD73_04460 [Deferribacteraceae bacterium]|nr:hypothetical protein [Deferribacteraceae bacterium]
MADKLTLQGKIKKKSINRIFTGRFLYAWYTVFALVVLSMLINLWILSSVEEFRLTIYTPDGEPIRTQIVSKSDLEKLSDPRRADFVLEKGIEPYRACLFNIFRYNLCWNLVRGENS